MSGIQHHIVTVRHFAIESHHRVTSRGGHVFHTAHPFVLRDDNRLVVGRQLFHGYHELGFIQRRQLRFEHFGQGVLLCSGQCHFGGIGFDDEFFHNVAIDTHEARFFIFLFQLA